MSTLSGDTDLVTIDSIMKGYNDCNLIYLDIEGMEYVTIADLLFTGALCDNVDLLMGEFHVRQKYMFPIVTPRQGVVEENPGTANDTVNVLHKLLNQSMNCKTVVSPDQDESYLHDPMPFPDPPQLPNSKTVDVDSS